MNSASLSLQSKIAVVIGGTSGIGRAISLGLADAGAAVIASGRNKDKVDSVAARCA
jgi:NAD(P)-dependent dehydrogenase (short-subunit alcohol dehydrogenase family)